MTIIEMTKVMVGGECKYKLSPFVIDYIEKNTITITRVGGENYSEMESWLTEHEATVIGYYCSKSSYISSGI